ncbi:citrate synthase/methylcitrate synthase [Bacillus spongiae]|uniref:Citrate synthase n=1 Tax=Bacillus spongiae TaxID=2683610 RepID=A0ABU8HI06_9BACI
MLTNGLKGIVAAETAICHVDGKEGRLIYRGYEIRHLTTNYSFEAIAFLIWHGYLPTQEELTNLHQQLVRNRFLTQSLKTIIDALPDEMDMMSVLRTAISAEGTKNYSWKPTISQAIRLTALTPTIIAYRQSRLQKKEFTEPSKRLGHVENYLYMLHGEKPTKTTVNALETYMILTLEHGLNASAFSARVTASSESDMVSAIAAAIGTMKGPLHGGAPSGVIKLLNEIKTEDRARHLLKTKLINGEKLMGFGHRIYKTHDPRAIALKGKLLEMIGENNWLDLAIHVENIAIDLLSELKPGRGLYTNIEFYAAAIMKAIDLDSDLFTPTFTVSRMVGWTAHIIEQSENNTIFRPQSEYIGEVKKATLDLPNK